MSQPLISIITPSYNRAQFIREAIQSVLDQNYPHVEHIIIDAVSTDGTMEVLHEYSHLRVVSEPDDGMYDAINKGIRIARGEVIGLLNTDDLYSPDTFKFVSDAFDKNPAAITVVGGVATFEERNGNREFINHFAAIAPDDLWYRVIQGHPVTNAWFFRRELFDVVGFFDTNFRYAADRYFLIKIVLDNGVRPVPVHKEFYYYRQHSGSVTMTTLDSRSQEYGLVRMKILREDIAGLEGFLNRTTLPDEVSRRMRRAHGECCYRLAATALYHHDWKRASFAINHGFHYNLLWLFIFFEMAIMRLRNG
jgi:glycosyltransferase involved in cell wall biosynthesis